MADASVLIWDVSVTALGKNANRMEPGSMILRRPWTHRARFAAGHQNCPDRLSLPSIAVSRRCRTRIKSRARASSTTSLTVLAFDGVEDFAEPGRLTRGAIELDGEMNAVVEAADALPPVTVTSWANSEVLPSGSMAVAAL